MKKTVLWSAALTGVLLGALRAEAQQATPVARSLSLADAVRMEMVRTSLVSGRISAKILRARSLPFQSRLEGRIDTLTLRLSNGESIRYESTSLEERIVIEINGGNQVQMVRLPKEGSSEAAVEFQQPSQGMMSLAVGSGPKRQVYRASSLWHLLMGNREVCRQHLVPLAQMINADWDLAAVSEDVEQALVARAGSLSATDRSRWEALVRQLGSDQFSQRQAADRELRAFGRVVLGFLERLDPEQLDAEQELRVRRIVLSLSPGDREGSPEQIAAWLAGDPRIWVELLAREEEATRRTAVEQLRLLLDRPVAFDPGADAETRQAQRERLRAELAGD